jgi:hypothetical protein
MRHRRQPAAELRGRYAGHGAAEPFAPRPTAHGLAAGGAGVGEVEILDHHRRTSVIAGVI